MRYNTFTISDRDWGDITIARILPTKDNGSWGDFYFLIGTEWENQIIEINGDIYSMAMNKHTIPLIRKLGTPYPQKLKRIPKSVGWCKGKTDKTCDMANSTCYPCEKVAECYEPKGFGILETIALAELVLIWKNGGYVIRVVGREFSLH
tara:strand:+ start:318 stop:764 length:447 start_codon:yes stop_codon:yes gene_type:complete